MKKRAGQTRGEAGTVADALERLQGLTVGSSAFDLGLHRLRTLFYRWAKGEVPDKELLVSTLELLNEAEARTRGLYAEVNAAIKLMMGFDKAAVYRGLQDADASMNPPGEIPF